MCCFMWNCVRFFMLFMYSKVFSSSRRFSECWGNVQIILGAVPRFAAFVAEKGCAALKLIIFHNNFLLHKVPLIAILRYRTRRLQPFRFCALHFNQATEFFVLQEKSILLNSSIVMMIRACTNTIPCPMLTSVEFFLSSFFNNTAQAVSMCWQQLLAE